MSTSSRNSASRGSSARTVKTKRARRIVGPDRVPRPESGSFEIEEAPKRSAPSAAIEVARDTAREIADRGKRMITDRGKKLYEQAKRKLSRGRRST